jgi:Tol biopolymer transport system component
LRRVPFGDVVEGTRATYTRCVRRLASLVRIAGLLIVFALVFASASGGGFGRQPGVEHLVDDDGGSFSPDGQTIVFGRLFSTLRYGVDTHPVPEEAVLLLMRADGARKRALRHAGARFEYDASFSPDGRSILFVRDERIFLMRRDGSGVHPVRRDFLEQACPRFSPDGTMISLWRGRGTKSGAYFVMNADGTGLRRIVNSGGEMFAWGCPSWFPDGKQVVFVKDYNLYVASVDGTSIERLTDEKDGTLYRPAVSPDGRWIVCDGFMNGRAAGNGVILMRADGTRIRRITSYTDEFKPDGDASWSPDSRQIIFSGYRGRLRGAGVYIIARDGSGLRRLSNFAR